MIMFDIRDKNDIIRDIGVLNDICQEWSTYAKCLHACISQLNIKSIENCTCKLEERFKCPKCKGSGYVVVLNENKKEGE